MSACKSAETPAPAQPQEAAQPAAQPVEEPAGQPSTAAETTEEPEAEQAPQVDLTKLPEDAVTIYTQGSTKFSMKDILPILSDSSGYSQKWEFYIYTRPYEVRVKFEISNFAFSKNEGKIRGYVRRYDDKDEQIENYSLSKNLKNGQWKARKDTLALEFDDYSLSWQNGMFHLKGSYDKGTFEYDIPANPWKPGTGVVYFGNNPSNVFKYSILTYHQQVAKGTVVADGTPVEVKGQAYANHYATNIAVYDMFDEVADFRKRTENLLVEFRYYEPSAKYNAQPFGFFFVAFEGQPVFSSTSIERTPLETWLDEENYGYEISSRQRIVAHDGSNSATFEMLTAEPEAKDVYADLPAFQRNVASRFAKPIEYSIPIDWELLLNVDGYQAKIPMSASYSITRLR